jgi:hypothetical protein
MVGRGRGKPRRRTQRNDHGERDSRAGKENEQGGFWKRNAKKETADLKMTAKETAE